MHKKIKLLASVHQCSQAGARATPMLLSKDRREGHVVGALQENLNIIDKLGAVKVSLFLNSWENIATSKVRIAAEVSLLTARIHSVVGMHDKSKLGCSFTLDVAFVVSPICERRFSLQQISVDDLKQQTKRKLLDEWQQSSQRRNILPTALLSMPRFHLL
jgi:hypothetical protein